MPLDNNTGNNTLNRFLQAWPISSLRNMRIEEYADLSNHNAYCYWLEYGSRDLGEIGGMPLTKFGLWKYKNLKEFSATYEFDTVYAWNKKFGTTRMQVFNNIRAIIVEIAECAALSNWGRIQEIEFHAIAKWKIAFLYSGKMLVPIYSRENLLKVARGLGSHFPEDAPIVRLQTYITQRKSADQDMIDYAKELSDHYVNGKPFRNYFIVGSKYKDSDGKDSKDVFPVMLATNSVAIGFLSEFNLSNLVGETNEKINSFVQANAQDDIAVFKLQSYFRILLNLKPGDIVAIKSQGSHGMLEIIAYAVVTEKDGKVYEYRPDSLGHHIHVEFVELGICRRTGLNYAGTIHHISPDKTDHLAQIFGPFMQVDNIALGDETEDLSATSDDRLLKSEEDYERGAIASKMVRQLHNMIQNSFYRYLLATYPHQKIIYEFENRVDIIRESETERWFYEVKPFENIVSCLRQATGQLIEYAYRFQNSEKTTNLVIVGPGTLNGEGVAFFNYFVEMIGLPLSYEQHLARELDGNAIIAVP